MTPSPPPATSPCQGTPHLYSPGDPPCTCISWRPPTLCEDLVVSLQWAYCSSCIVWFIPHTCRFPELLFFQRPAARTLNYEYCRSRCHFRLLEDEFGARVNRLPTAHLHKTNDSVYYFFSSLFFSLSLRDERRKHWRKWGDEKRKLFFVKELVPGALFSHLQKIEPGATGCATRQAKLWWECWSSTGLFIHPPFFCLNSLFFYECTSSQLISDFFSEEISLIFRNILRFACSTPHPTEIRF